MTDARSLVGVRVLIPRGGDVGARLAAAVSARGGVPIIAPVVEFTPPANLRAIADACDRLTAGEFDWVAVTSATTVRSLVQHGVRIPHSTRVAVVGPATRDAMEAAGFRVDFVPSAAFSAVAMVAEWPGDSGSVLLPQSALAEPTLADGLAERGLDVTTVAAYDTTALGWDTDLRARLGRGDFGAVLLTSASVAQAVAGQGVAVPGETIVACIGESTAVGARATGLSVHVVAESSTAEGLVDTLGDYFSSIRQHPNRTEATP